MMVQFFRNGDPDNDPTIDMLEGTWPFNKPEGWEPFPMNADLLKDEYSYDGTHLKAEG